MTTPDVRFSTTLSPLMDSLRTDLPQIVRLIGTMKALGKDRSIEVLNNGTKEEAVQYLRTVADDYIKISEEVKKMVPLAGEILKKALNAQDSIAAAIQGMPEMNKEIASQFGLKASVEGVSKAHEVLKNFSNALGEVKKTLESIDPTFKSLEDAKSKNSVEPLLAAAFTKAEGIDGYKAYWTGTNLHSVVDLRKIELAAKKPAVAAEGTSTNEGAPKQETAPTTAACAKGNDAPQTMKESSHVKNNASQPIKEKSEAKIERDALREIILEIQTLLKEDKGSTKLSLVASNGSKAEEKTETLPFVASA